MRYRPTIIPDLPAFSFDPLGRKEYDPYGSGIIQRPQGAQVIADGGISSLTNPYAVAKYYTKADGSIALSTANVPYVNFVSGVPVGVLWEPAATNVLQYSQKHNTSPWATVAGSGATVNETFSTAPDGTATGNKWTFAANSDVWGQAYTVAIGVGEKWTASAWVRNASASGITLRVFRAGAGTAESSTLAITNTTSTWTRISLTHTFANVQSGIRFDIANTSAGAGASLEVWGAMLVKESGVSSYIPTTNAVGNRSADACTHSSAFLNAIKAAGRITVKWTPNAASSGASRYLFDCRDGSNNGFGVVVTSDGKLTLAVNSAGASVQSAALTWTPGTTYEVTVYWNGTSWRATRNATEVIASTALSAVSTIGALAYLGAREGGISQADGSIQLVEAA